MAGEKARREASKSDARWRVLEEIAAVRSAGAPLMGYPVDGYTLEVDPVLTQRSGGCSVARMCEEVGVPLASRAEGNLRGEFHRQGRLLQRPRLAPAPRRHADGVAHPKGRRRLPVRGARRR